MIGLTLQSARAAHHLHAAKFATGKSNHRGACYRRMIEIVVHIAGNKKIQTAVAIVVTKSCASRPVAQSDSRFLRNISKRSIVIIVIKAILAEIRHVKGRPSIVVIIAHGHAESPAVIGTSGLLRDIGEGSVVIVVKKSGVRGRGLAGY